ncbi:hypothetical protein [Stenotrophomonas sp.]|uniref:hypothetical protein n=1 Tax=Stenotrophomonas sp. TaxID=69392 RepID=UPI0028AAAAEE|nr:hypothetical protein [Stenotrophomonas sp.]
MPAAHFMLRCLVAGAAALLPLAVQAAPPRYIDLADWRGPGEPIGDSPFHGFNGWIIYEFNDICPDFFCEGGYDNYRLLRLSCVVDTRTDSIRECRLPVAASRDHVHPGTGALRTDIRHWRCPVPLPRGLPVTTFLAAIDWQPGSSGHLFNPLPGSGRSMFDALQACLP